MIRLHNYDQSWVYLINKKEFKMTTHICTFKMAFLHLKAADEYNKSVQYIPLGIGPEAESSLKPILTMIMGTDSKNSKSGWLAPDLKRGSARSKLCQ